MKYLKIRNWDKWQSYRKDRGQPPWIKVHRCLMRDPEWVSLSDAERGQLASMWMLAADKEGLIPEDPNLIQKLCFLDKKPNINRFIELHFIESTVITNGDNLASSGSQMGSPEENRIEADAEKNRKEDILSFALEVGFPVIRGDNSKRKNLGRIGERLNDNYSVDDIKGHLSRFINKKKIHESYTKKYGVEPEINSKAWCPNTGWNLMETLSPVRMEKYFHIWESEGMLDIESTIAECRKLQEGKHGTNKNQLEGHKYGGRSDDRPYKQPDITPNNC